MAGAAIQLDLRPLQKAQDWINRLHGFDRSELMQGLVSLTESQTRRRIEFEKVAPDGTPWPDWSDAYAAERPSGASLLQASGALLDSIRGELQGDEGVVGSHLVYAGIQNDGGTTKAHEIRPKDKQALAFGGGHPVKVVKHPGSEIPARTYLGYSDDNRLEIQAEAIAFFEALLQ